MQVQTGPRDIARLHPSGRSAVGGVEGEMRQSIDA